MADADATQEEVNTAWDNLLNGIWGLGLTQGDKTMLNLVIDRAEAMMDEADKYVETNWQQLVDALKAAQDVAADGDAMQEDVDKAAGDLLWTPSWPSATRPTSPSWKASSARPRAWTSPVTPPSPWPPSAPLWPTPRL